MRAMKSSSYKLKQVDAKNINVYALHIKNLEEKFKKMLKNIIDDVNIIIIKIVATLIKKFVIGLKLHIMAKIKYERPN